MNTLEVFTYRQYSKTTIARLHADLQKIRHPDVDQRDQLSRCREEMERRGIKLTRPKKP